MGILSVVGTPIGNLGDMTYRAVETLEKADFICAEDTRVTAKLLNYFDIKTPLVSYHEHNAKQVGESILNRIMARTLLSSQTPVCPAFQTLGSFL